MTDNDIFEQWANDAGVKPVDSKHPPQVPPKEAQKGPKIPFHPSGKEAHPPSPQRRKAGRNEYQEKIDLHGETRESALAKLRLFMIAARARGSRRVLVITGKGIHSGEGGGVIRKIVRRWLQEERLLKFRQAPEKLGGAGAFLVNLK